MDQMDESNPLSSGSRPLFRFHFGVQRISKWCNSSPIVAICIKLVKVYLLLTIGIPPSLVHLRPRRLPGRFILSPYRILFICTILCGVAAAALSLVGQSSSSGWVGIAGSGIMAMILFLLKEHRDDFPDFAPWLFETDYKAGFAFTAMLLVQLGMAHLPVHRIWSLICTQIESDSGWTGYYTRLLPLEALYGWTALGGRLRIGNTFGVPKNPVSYFLMEELLILGSRLVNMLIFLVVVKIKPQALMRCIFTALALCVPMTLGVLGALDHIFKDTLSRLAESYKSTFEVQNDVEF